MKTTIVCDDWRALRRNTLQGFAAITIQELRLSIKDIAIHEKNHRRWAQLPARPQIKDGKAVTDADGKVQYFPVMAFEGRAIADAFSNAVIAASSGPSRTHSRIPPSARCRATRWPTRFRSEERHRC
jgi:hypothetical protein